MDFALKVMYLPVLNNLSIFTGREKKSEIRNIRINLFYFELFQSILSNNWFVILERKYPSKACKKLPNSTKTAPNTHKGEINGGQVRNRHTGCS